MAKAICGIYKITNTVNGKVYIGRSIDIKTRWKDHKAQLRNNKKIENTYLQRAWNKYGEHNFTFEILEECAKDVIDVREQHYIDLYDSAKRCNGYNLRGAEGINSISAEQKLRISGENHYNSLLNVESIKIIRYIKYKYDKYKLAGIYTSICQHFGWSYDSVKQWDSHSWKTVPLTQEDIQRFEQCLDLSFMENYNYAGATLTLKQYREVKGLLLSNCSCRQIADNYNVRRDLIQRIKDCAIMQRIEPIMPTQELLESLKK